MYIFDVGGGKGQKSCPRKLPEMILFNLKSLFFSESERKRMHYSDDEYEEITLY